MTKTPAAAVAAALLVLAAAGCSAGNAADATPPRDPAPAPTPPASAIDIAGEKATAAYRAAFHLVQSDHSSIAPPEAEMAKYMAGSYLKYETSQFGVSTKGVAYLDGVVVGGTTGDPYAPSTIQLTGCENGTHLTFFKNGKQVNVTNSALYVQHLVASRGSDGTWRVSQQTGTDVIQPAKWESQVCYHPDGQKSTT